METEGIPQLTCTAVIKTRSVCGSGSDLFYLYADADSSAYIGCLRETPTAGRTYRTKDRRRVTVDVTVAAGFTMARL
jgi:hypothetical protein